ncbi:MAG: hypothetical protein D8M58_17595 [Calditrichaeota bacterium]|nr:MAG: hypothetical protein DWQ03_01510 [Calditrichota bacterium]MBL1207221.1 hypothetical protein [Calditrichota bacterium]NOG47054.1 hypothetical protein [Calditrichota bacterium]
MNIQNNTPARKNVVLVTMATALISMSMIIFELVLTRIFSVMLSYHYVFLILSVAMFGLGMGGFLLDRWKLISPKTSYETHAMLSAIMIGLVTLIIIKVPLFEIKFLQGSIVWIYVLLASLPFFFLGMTLAGIFKNFAQKSSLIYGFDLLGAATGIVIIIPIIKFMGAVNTALISTVIAGLSSIVLAFTGKEIKRYVLYSVFILLAIAGSLILFDKNAEVPVTQDINKDMNRMLNNVNEQAEIVESRWSAFGRTDLVKSKSLPDQMILYVDGAAGTSMYNLQELQNDSIKLGHFRYHFGGYFPFLFLEENEKDNALIIGSGGGRDVIVALLGDVNSVTAVEVNPDLVDIVKDYESFNGGLYSSLQNVSVVVNEGRNYIKNSAEKFDLIMMSLPITKSSRSIDGYALTENYLFTVEAMTDYLKHLTPEGRIIIVAHNDKEVYRIISLAISSFKEKGITDSEAMKHIYTIASGMMPTIVIKNSPFDSTQASIRHDFMHKLGFDRGNYFVPFIDQMLVNPDESVNIDKTWRMFDQILVDIASGELKFEQLIKSAVVDISPVFDDSPFFYNFQVGLPDPFGLFTLFLIIIGVLFILPLLARNTSGRFHMFAKKPQLKVFLVIFFLTGNGFMLLEIAFFQKLNLYLGQPVLALTILLFSLLLGTGAGSLLSGKILKYLKQSIIISALFVVTLTIIYNIAFPFFFEFNMDSKIIAVILLFPLGIFLGFPFPLSIRLMKKYQLENYINIMWGVNGIASVTGSVLAVIVGILAGFSTAVNLGALAYLFVALMVFLLLKTTKNQELIDLKKTTQIS